MPKYGVIIYNSIFQSPKDEKTLFENPHILYGLSPCGWRSFLVSSLPSLHSFFKVYRWSTAREIIIGIRSIKKIPEKVKYYNAKRILVICGPTIRKIGLVDKVIEQIKTLNVEFEVFDKVEPEPHIETAEELKDIVREGKFNLVIGVGGGSVLDVSKITALMATNSGNVEDYIGMYKIKKPGIPKILIPTTAGTGSEVTEAIVLKGKISSTKAVIYSEYAPAEVAILDPEMTLPAPPKVTAATGMDALSHAIESYMSIDSTPFSEAFAEKAISLIADNLRKAVFQGQNIIARYNMLLASTLASMAWSQSSVCQGHAIGLAIGTKYNLPHGVSVALALPYVMWFNRVAIPERLAYIAMLMGVDVSGLTPYEASFKAIEAVLNLENDIGLPTKLKDIPSAKRDDIPELAEGAYKAQRLLIHSPRITTKKDLETIINMMYEGDLSRKVSKTC